MDKKIVKRNKMIAKSIVIILVLSSVLSVLTLFI